MADPILEFENVSLSYDDKLVLDGINLTVNPGDTYILLGAAGSGKTVLLKLAMSLIKPSSGRIRLLGLDITDLEETALFDEMEALEEAASPESRRDRRHRCARLGRRSRPAGDARSGRAVFLPHVAHMIGMEMPDELAALIIDFVAPLPRWS